MEECPSTTFARRLLTINADILRARADGFDDLAREVLDTPHLMQWYQETTT
jgi:hypothetical protein